MAPHFALWIGIMMEASPKCAQMYITEAGGIHGLFGAQKGIWMGYTTTIMNQIRPGSFGFNLTVISLLKKCEWWYENHSYILTIGMNQVSNGHLCFTKDQKAYFMITQFVDFRFILYWWIKFWKKSRKSCICRNMFIGVCHLIYEGCSKIE